MPDITCQRCNETKAALEEAPTGGEVGTLILARICQECWDEWRETSTQLINHHGLNLGMPDHRKELRRVMKEFLGLVEDRPSP